MILNDYWYQIEELPQEAIYIKDIEIITHKKSYITRCRIVKTPKIQSEDLKEGDIVYCRRKFHIINDCIFIHEDDIYLKEI